MLELLLQAGANPKLKTKEGLSATDLAAKYGHAHHKAILEAAR
jgi:ankyrin repeat protein